LSTCGDAERRERLRATANAASDTFTALAPFDSIEVVLARNTARWASKQLGIEPGAEEVHFSRLVRKRCCEKRALRQQAEAKIHDLPARRRTRQ
jgi:hypothetical protein